MKYLIMAAYDLWIVRAEADGELHGCSRDESLRKYWPEERVDDIALALCIKMGNRNR